MPAIETKNARIQSTMLGIEDHGIMSFSLYLDYGSSGQGAGGYCLDTPVKDSNGRFIKRVGTAAGTTIIMEILRVVGVDKWEDLPNKHIRVRADHCKVHAIGHLLKDEWLDFGAFFEQQTTAAAVNG
jgi:hypothetical protein